MHNKSYFLMEKVKNVGDAMKFNRPLTLPTVGKMKSYIQKAHVKNATINKNKSLR